MLRNEELRTVCNESTKGDDSSFNTDQETSVTGTGTFCLVGRNGGCVLLELEWFPDDFVIDLRFRFQYL
jgi:hypothetical protein